MTASTLTSQGGVFQFCSLKLIFSRALLLSQASRPARQHVDVSPTDMGVPSSGICPAMVGLFSSLCSLCSFCKRLGVSLPCGGCAMLSPAVRVCHENMSFSQCNGVLNCVPKRIAEYSTTRTAFSFSLSPYFSSFHLFLSLGAFSSFRLCQSVIVFLFQ